MTPIAENDPIPAISNRALAGMGIVGLALVLLIAAVLVAPWMAAVLGLSVIAAGVVASVPNVWRSVERYLGLCPRPGLVHVLRAGGLLTVGLCLFVASAATILERQRAQAREAEFASRMAAARTALAEGRLNEAGELVDRANAMPGRAGSPEAADLRRQVEQAKEQAALVAARARAATLLQLAESAIDQRDYSEATRLLGEYVARPQATETDAARTTLRELGVVSSGEQAVAMLEGLSDEQFAEWVKAGSLPVALRPTRKGLTDAYLASVRSSTPEATRGRQARRQREEAERKAN